MRLATSLSPFSSCSFAWQSLHKSNMFLSELFPRLRSLWCICNIELLPHLSQIIRSRITSLLTFLLTDRYGRLSFLGFQFGLSRPLCCSPLCFKKQVREQNFLCVEPADSKSFPQYKQALTIHVSLFLSFHPFGTNFPLVASARSKYEHFFEQVKRLFAFSTEGYCSYSNGRVQTTQNFL